MAEDAVKVAIQGGKLEDRPCVSQDLPDFMVACVNIRIMDIIMEPTEEKIRALQKEDPVLAEKIHPDLPYKS